MPPKHTDPPATALAHGPARAENIESARRALDRTALIVLRERRRKAAQEQRVVADRKRAEANHVTTTDQPPCPRCGEAIPTTARGDEPVDQLALGHAACPVCGATLERSVEGHADHGWRLVSED
jgi:predicted RNA-binding Zn-ribbon protein involved in translation (DUF1610 family)